MSDEKGSDWMPEVIEKELDKFFSDLSNPPPGWVITNNHEKDNSGGSYEVFPKDAKKWDDIEKVIIDKNVNSSYEYEYKRDPDYVKSEKIDITKIKLKVCDIPGAGKEVFAFIDQPIPCCEFTMKGNAYQPITHTCQPSEHEHKLYTERWIQFEPPVWSQMIEEVYAEMVKLWNEKHGKGVKEND